MNRKLFELEGRNFFCMVLKNIPNNMLIETQKFLKSAMDSPGKVAPVASKASNCLRIYYIGDVTASSKVPTRVAVIKSNLQWLMANRLGIFYVDYSEYKLQSIISAFNSGDFSAFTLHKELEPVETYSVF